MCNENDLFQTSGRRSHKSWALHGDQNSVRCPWFTSSEEDSDLQGGRLAVKIAFREIWKEFELVYCYKDIKSTCCRSSLSLSTVIVMGVRSRGFNLSVTRTSDEIHLKTREFFTWRTIIRVHSKLDDYKLLWFVTKLYLSRDLH